MRHIHGILIQWRPRNHHRPFILLVERLVLLAVSSTQQPPLLPLTPPPRVRQYRSLPGKGNSLLDERGIPNISKPSINTNSCAAHSPKSVLFPPSFHKQATWERPRVVNLRTMTSSRRMASFSSPFDWELHHAKSKVDGSFVSVFKTGTKTLCASNAYLSRSIM